MIGWLGAAIIVGSLLTAVLAGISALRRRGPYLVALAVGVLTEVLAIVQALVAISASASGTGRGAAEPVLFFSYLVAVLLILPIAVWLARAEPNRFGSLVIVVGGLVLAVLVVRLQQLWGAPVG